MPSLRKYYLKCEPGKEDMRPKLKQRIRNVSINSSGDTDGSVKSGYVCEVRKIPTAPEYEIHYVKTKRDGIQMVKTRKKTAGQAPEKPARLKKRKEEATTSEDERKIETDNNEGEMVGLRVIACHKRDGLYYPGQVSGTCEAAYAVVQFKGQEKSKVSTRNIIPIGGAVPRPELALGDFVLVQVYNQSKHQECYVPGIVEFVPEDLRQHNRFYTLMLYNGQRETTMRKYIVKIGRARFEMAVKYIALVQQGLTRGREGSVSETSEPSSRPRPTSKQSERSDDGTDQSSLYSQDSRNSRRKKKKYTEKLKKKEEKKKRSRSPRTSSRSSSRSKSRSNSSRSRSRSRSSSRSRSRNSSRSTSRSRSRSRSPRRSRRRSRSRSKSRSRSRSNSRHKSSSKSKRSRSKSYSSRSRSRSRSRTPEKVRKSSRSKRGLRKSELQTKSRSSKRSTSRSSRSSSRTRTPSKESVVSKRSDTPLGSPVERPSNPVPQPRPVDAFPRSDSFYNNVTRQDIYQEAASVTVASRMGNVDEKDQMIGELQYQLEKQKRKQLRQERRLVRQARKLNKIQRHLEVQNDSVHSDQSRSVRSSLEQELISYKRKESPDGTSYKDLRDSRTSVKDLRYKDSRDFGRRRLWEDQEVLARWSDDGWYYNGVVCEERETDRYLVKDATGHMEAIWREDILAEEDHNTSSLQAEDYVIALHPQYVFSYAPGKVIHISHNDVMVNFLDGTRAVVSIHDVYKISREKCKKDMMYIKECEENLFEKEVIARDDRSGEYKKALVTSKPYQGKFKVKFHQDPSGEELDQSANQAFDPRQRQPKHDKWEYVLAPTDSTRCRYMPAKVLREHPFTIHICDEESVKQISMEDCFWLNQDYYKNAVEFFLYAQEGASLSEEE